MGLEFCPTLEELYRVRQAVGRSGKPFHLTSGLSTVNNLLAIRRMMLELKPERTLEIGMACGGSTLTFAATHRDLNRLAHAQHVAIDGFQRDGFDDVGRLKLQEAGLSEYVEVQEEISALALPTLMRQGQRFQMIYIDGSHQYEDVFCDFYFVRFLIDMGGIILFDDGSDPHVVKVTKFIRSNLREHFEHIPLRKYRKLSLFNRLKYSIAEALHKTQLTTFRKVKEGVGRTGHRLRSF